MKSKLIYPGSPGCFCRVWERHERLILQGHPLHNKSKEPQSRPIPVMEGLALLKEAKECYDSRSKELASEISILEDMV